MGEVGIQAWFEEVANRLCDIALELELPMAQRELKVSLAPQGEDEFFNPFPRKLSADWYDDDQRYGFVLKWWEERRPWPSIEEVIAAARPFLEKCASHEIGLRQPNTVWLGVDYGQ